MSAAAHHVVTMPAIRAIATHAGRYLVVGTVIPTGLFYGAFNLIGLRLAMIISLAWSLALIVHRLRGGHRVEATLMLGIVLAITRFAIAFTTGSSFLYFLQPTISTYVTAFALIGSVFIGRPFTQRATRDYVPLPTDLVTHPAIEKFFIRVSLVWGFGYLINGTISLWLLTHSSVNRFVIVSKAMGLSMTGLTLLFSLVLLWTTMRRASIKLRWRAHHDPTLTAPVTLDCADKPCPVVSDAA